MCDHQVESKSSHNTTDNYVHMFTFPYATVANSLAFYSQGLDKLNNICGTPTFHNTILSTYKLVKSTIVDLSSVRSLSPEVDSDGNIMDFYLLW